MSTNFRSIQSSPDAEVSIVTATPVRPLNEKASSMVLHSSPTGGTLLSTTASSTPVRSRSPTFSSNQKFILHEPERLAAGTTPRQQQQQRSAFGASSSEATSEIGHHAPTTNGITTNNTPDWRMFHSDETRHRGAPSSVEDISKDNSTMYSSSNIYATIPKIISATSVNNPGNTKVLLSEATGPPPRPPHPDDIVDPHFQLRFRDLPTQVQQQKIYEWKMSYLSHRARKRNQQQQQHHQQQQQPMVVPPSSSDSNHILFGHSVAGSRTTTIPTASPQVRSTSPFARTTSATTTSNQRFPSPHRSDTTTKSSTLSGPVNRSQVPTTETLNSFLYTGVQPTLGSGGQSAFSRSSTTTSVPQQHPRQSSGSPATNTRSTAPRNGGTLKNISTYQRSMTPTSSSPAQPGGAGDQRGSGGRDVVAKSGYHRSFTPPISKSQVPWVHRKY